jgi:curved DNA-binding protein
MKFMQVAKEKQVQKEWKIANFGKKPPWKLTRQEIQAAYDTLGDAAKRAEYDNPRPQFSGFPGGAQFNMKDIFGQMFGGQSPFGQPRRPNHVRTTIWTTLEEVAQSGSRTMQVRSDSGTSTVQIQIPPGIEDGDNVQYSGVGPNGMDLMVQFKIHPHAQWRRDGLTLHTDHAISVWDMILGGETEIKTILGTGVVIRIPPNTQPGAVMRLRAHGLSNSQGQRGDVMIRLQAQIPAVIAPEILTAIEQHR